MKRIQTTGFVEGSGRERQMLHVTGHEARRGQPLGGEAEHINGNIETNGVEATALHPVGYPT